MNKGGSLRGLGQTLSVSEACNSDAAAILSSCPDFRAILRCQ